MVRLSNPFAFTRGPVTVITTLIYAAIIVALIVTHSTVPPAPKTAVPIDGVNLTEAWHDLQLLSSSYHPFNSRQNDKVHDWLLLRIEAILSENKASSLTTTASSPAAYLFSDTNSNLTFSSPGSATTKAGVSVYFEGTNIIVYVRGAEDDQAEWWKDPKGKPSSHNGVLVNAHYDSVASGYGATDDGVGVVTILQLIKYYTTSGNTPKHGLVMLLNNGEEDFLNGARVFGQHPMAKLPSTFLNLEGAGAGGRAALFRSTDAEVTKAYSKSPYPFGTVVSGDGFRRGLVRSQTDYVIFNGILGLRGLDVAFIEPRARYHTNQDDSTHTGKNSLWHMLSTAVATTQQLTEGDFEKESGSGSVWFDVLGRAFAVFKTHTLFALSVTLLVVAPVFLFATMIILYRVDKLYLLSGSRRFVTREGEESISLYGWRGFFRFPFIFLFACAAPVALAYLLFKENQFIAHSSEWAVWSMMVSSFIFVAWFFARSAHFTRPSALVRAYGLSWMCVAWWAVLVVATVYEEHFHMAGGYFVLVYFSSIFIATLLSYLELFSLTKKSKYCHSKIGEEYVASRSTSASRPQSALPVAAEEEDTAGEIDEEEDVNEQSSLLRSRGRSTFKNYATPAADDEDVGSIKHRHNGHEEQEWSKSLWSWMWLLEFLLLAPINIILLGQIALFMVSALHQTGADGSSMFLVYMGIAIMTIVIFSPLVPILHRFTWHIPVFCLLVLVATLIYNLIAFPFSPANRLKLFFQQELDLDAGTNQVSFLGVPPYVRDAVSELPSSAGQELNCVTFDGNREKCSWIGTPPNVGGSLSALPFSSTYRSLVNYNVTRLTNNTETNTARFKLYGRNTRACKLVFDSPISSFNVYGQAPVDKRMPPVPDAGSREIRLWSRTWERAWTVDVTWESDDSTQDNQAVLAGIKEKRKQKDGLTGKVVCLWSDANQMGTIPAYDEAIHYSPEWVAVTKAGDGLVEGFKRFIV